MNTCRITLFTYLIGFFQGIICYEEYNMVVLSLSVFCSSVVYHNMDTQHPLYLLIRKIDMGIVMVAIIYHITRYVYLALHLKSVFIFYMYKTALIFYIGGRVTTSPKLGYILYCTVPGRSAHV